MSTTVIKGPDLFPALLTDRQWSTIGDDHHVLAVGGNYVLFWDRRTAEWSIFEYDWFQKDKGADPFLPAAAPKELAKGDWVKQGLRKPHQLFWLGGRRMLDWQPTSGTTSQARLWHFDPTRRGQDPIVGDVLCETAWTATGNDHRVSYLGQDWVCIHAPKTGQPDSSYWIYRVNRNPKKKDEDPVPTANFVCSGVLKGVDFLDRFHYLGQDRLMVWTPHKGRYRVFRLDRGARGEGAQLFFQPLLAEGTKPADEVGLREFFTLLGEGLPRTRLLAFAPEDKARNGGQNRGRARVWLVPEKIPDVPLESGVPGIRLLRPDSGPMRIIVSPRELFGSSVQGPTIDELAQRVHLPAPQVFVELLKLPENLPAMRKLHEGNIGPTPADGDAVRALQRQGSREIPLFQGDRYTYQTKTPFTFFRVDPATPLQLTLSPAYRSVLADQAKERDRLKRQEALQTGGFFKAFRERMLELEKKVFRLQTFQNQLAAGTRLATRDAAILEQLDLVLGLVENRGRSKVDAGKMRDLRNAVGLVRGQHILHCIDAPKDHADTHKARNDLADEVLRMIEEPEFLKDAKRFGENIDAAFADDITYAHDQTRNAYTLLLVSQHARHIVTRHIQPLIEQFASRVRITQSSGNPEMDPHLSSSVKPTDSPSLLAYMSSGAGAAGTGAGNSPGPASLAVVIFHVAAPSIVQLSGALDRAGMYRSGAFLMRALCWAGNLEPKQTETAMLMVREGRLGIIKQVDWAKNFQGGKGGTAAVGILNLVTLVAAITSDEASTIKKVSNIVSSAASLGATSLQFVSAFSKALSASKAAGIAGRSLGTVGAIIGACLGAAQAMDANEQGDNYGFWLAAVGAGASAATALGFIAAGGIMGATGIGAPVGAMLMTIGIIIGLATGILSIYRDVTTSKSHRVVAALVAFYGRNDGPKMLEQNDKNRAEGKPPENPEQWIGSFARCSDKPGADLLAINYRMLQEAHQPGAAGWLPYIDPTPRPDDEEVLVGGLKVKCGAVEILWDVGLDEGMIGAACDLEEDAVKDRLKKTRAKEWPRVHAG